MAPLRHAIRLLLDQFRHRLRQKRWPADLALGRRGEDLAHRFLQKAGFEIVARNYRVDGLAGEIDLIGWQHGALVFIEVKTRRSDEFGPPERAISHHKEDVVRRAARRYARRADTDWQKVRFDVVAITLEPQVRIEHFPSAFPPAPRRRL